MAAIEAHRDGDSRPAGVVRIIGRTNVGGPALVVTALMRRLDASSFHQVLLRGTVDEDEADYLQLRAPDVESSVIPGLGRAVRPFDDIRAMWHLIRQLRALRPSIVHTHTAKAGVVGRIAAIITGVPIRVHTFHGHLLHGYFGPRVTSLIVLTERLLGQRTTFTLVEGEQVRRDLVARRVTTQDRSRVMPPGVAPPVPVAREELRRSLGIESTQPVILFVARLTRIKRAERFVELARSIRDRIPGARFVVVGDGPERAELEGSAGDLENLFFVGWRGDMDAVLAIADLIVLTSDNEGMPLVLIEAAMSGVPAVATDVGSVCEVVIDGVTGLLVGADEPDALVSAVESLLLDDTRRAELGAAAAERADRLFGEARLVREHEDLYRQLLSQVRTGRRWARA